MFSTDFSCQKSSLRDIQDWSRDEDWIVLTKSVEPVVQLSYLVSLVPICCLSSSLSSSVCLGRMFFSSSSRLEGLLLSLMAKESFLHTFIAREPAGGRSDLITLTHRCPGSHRTNCGPQDKGRKTTGLIHESVYGPKRHFDRVPTLDMFYLPSSVLSM